MGTDYWTTVSLESLCEGIYDGPHATPKKTRHGPIFLGISNLTHGRLDLTDVEIFPRKISLNGRIGSHLKQVTLSSLMKPDLARQH